MTVKHSSLFRNSVSDKENNFLNIETRCQCYKAFFFISNDEAKTARAFVHGMSFQPSLIHVSKVGAYPSGVHLLGRLHALPARQERFAWYERSSLFVLTKKKKVL